MNKFLFSINFFWSAIIFLFFSQFFWEQTFFLWFFSIIFLIFSYFFPKKYFLFPIFLWIFLWNILSYWKFLHFSQKKPENHINFFLKEYWKVKLSGKICDEIDKRIFNTKYTFCTEKITIKDKNLWKNKEIIVFWKILFITKSFDKYAFWDKLEIFWKLEMPKSDENFSYKNYLSIFEIYWIMKNPKILFYEKNEKKSFFWEIFDFKKYFLWKISKIYPEPHWSFLAGLLVWAKKWLPDEIKSDFQKNWLAHIVAISGYNMTMIIIFSSFIFAFLWRNLSFFLSIFFIILFTIFVWANSAVVRACLMGILWLFALRFWRENSVIIWILFSAFIISFYNPKILWWDLGFHLSFLSLIWVLYFSKIFQNFLEKWENILGLKEAMVLTLSASVMTFPIISYHFWFFSLISPISNIFIAPLTPLAMFFWFLSTLSPFSFFTNFFSFITYYILDLSLVLSHFFANLNFAIFEIKIGKIFFILSFIIIFSIIFLVNFRKNK